VKSVDEVLKMRKRRADKRVLKEQRKKAQDENKAKKDKKKEEHKLKTGNKEFTMTESDRQLLKDADEAIDDLQEDDAEYYEEEIGEKPEKELFENAVKASRKRPHIPKFAQKKFNKKPRLDKGDQKGQKNKGGHSKDKPKVFKSWKNNEKSSGRAKKFKKK
jgi:hypothetical protein